MVHCFVTLKLTMIVAMMIIMKMLMTDVVTEYDGLSYNFKINA